MKVLLINAPHAIQNMYGLKKHIPNLVYKQLGISYIAAGLEKKNHTVHYLDSQARQMSMSEVMAFIQQESPDLVGLPCYVLGRSQVYELVKQIKEQHPQLPVVVGGPHLTLFADRVFEECPEIDMALCGEADFSLASLVDAIERGESTKEIPGIVYRDEQGMITHGPPPEITMDMDSIPFPARHVYEAELYNPMPMMLSMPAMRSEQVITSRGCDWGKCRFCYQSSHNMPCYRRRSPENVIAELRALVDEYAVGFIVFTDDDFLRDEPWITHFCDLYDREKFSFKWNAIGRVNTVTPTMLKRVAQSGCVHVTYGLETGNQETLNLIRKGTTLAQAHTGVKWAHEAGLLVRAYIIFGLPRETPEMAEKSLQFVIDLDVDYVSFAPYHVLEGTSLEKIALEEGTCVAHDNLNCQLPSYLPNTYEGVEHLNMSIRTAYRKFYLRPRYMLKALWWAKDPRLWLTYLGKIWVGLQITFLGNR